MLFNSQALTGWASDRDRAEAGRVGYGQRGLCAADVRDPARSRVRDDDWRAL